MPDQDLAERLGETVVIGEEAEKAAHQVLDDAQLILSDDPWSIACRSGP